jgi:hypothetical protein
MVSFTPLLLYSKQKRPQYPLDRKLYEPPNRFEHDDEDKNSYSTTNQTLDIHPIASHYTDWVVPACYELQINS